MELRLKKEKATSPVSSHALLWRAEFMARGREALPPIPIIVTIFSTTAALPAPVPLSGGKNK
jgi:hypothetical protein